METILGLISALVGFVGAILGRKKIIVHRTETVVRGIPSEGAVSRGGKIGRLAIVLVACFGLALVLPEAVGIFLFLIGLVAFAGIVWHFATWLLSLFK